MFCLDYKSKLKSNFITKCAKCANSCFSVGSLQKFCHSDLMTQMSAGQEGQTLANAITTKYTDGKLAAFSFETSFETSLFNLDILNECYFHVNESG